MTRLSEARFRRGAVPRSTWRIGKEKKICRAGLRKKVENAARNVPDATLIDEDERWSDTDLVFDFVESIREIQ